MTMTMTKVDETAKRLKVGQLVWIDDPGSPNNDWNGASCVVENPAVGDRRQYVTVRPVIPVRGGPETNTFHAHQVKPETRPWLKKTLTDYGKMRDDLLKTAERVVEKYS